MSSEQNKDPINVVHLEGNSEKDPNNRIPAIGNQPLMSCKSKTNQKHKSESRSFWRAGDYAVGNTKSVTPQGQLEHARVHPKFLHSNATSHKWAFGAIAELLDNAVDEIRSGATYVKVDTLYNAKDESPALLFQDNGGGMDPDCMRQCMSLGYSSKMANTTIGQYGNGFKTSTMRLGADVIVFSRATRGSRVTQSIGLLSYTFLRKTGQDDVIVPMVDFEVTGRQTQPIICGSQADWSSNLKLILQWSPFASEEELMQQDICLKDEVVTGKGSRESHRLLESHISYQLRYSLRAYASILYLRKFTDFQIILRGKTVQQYIVAEDLKYSKVIIYKPKLGLASQEISVETTIGFVKEAPLLKVSGFNIYHKNRLIRPFWKAYHEGSSRGTGVVGVLEANFIEPAHDKQDFERSALYIRLETRIKQMIMEYWTGNCHKIGFQSRIPEIRCMQKELRVGEVSTGFKAGYQLPTEQPVVGLAANVPHGLAAGSSKEEESLDGLGSTTIEQICEENIQLFMKCKDHKEKENDLKNTVGKLEKQLQEAKRKCSQLASHIENRKKHLLAKQQEREKI
ncbi:protein MICRORCHIDIA 2-like isoform X2 [Papaver somniferum]|uniref:protein MICRORCHIDIA 2-like isoform X2 n=1 Tax=Papaver somniferum TaxID=3469 RepID=UPI000E704211|nr:protein MICRORCHIDIA 2-like isoform X2 [Papaver somniferum]